MLKNLVSFFHPFVGFGIFLNLILLIVLLYLNVNSLKQFFLKIKRTTWILLFAVLILALVLRIVIPSQIHLLYLDEYKYIEAGKNVISTGTLGDYAKSSGWPVILSIVFSVFGISNIVAIYTSIVFGSLTILLIFFLSLLLIKNQRISLFVALIFSLIPFHILWSSTAETNVVSVFFVALSLFFCCLYLESKDEDKLLFWLSWVTLAFTAQLRPENYILPLVFFLITLDLKKKHFLKSVTKSLVPLAVFLILSFGNFIVLFDFYNSVNWAESHTSGEITEKNFSLSNLWNNSKTWGVFIFLNQLHPYLFSLLFVLGFLYHMFNNKLNSFLFLLMLFCSFWIIYFSSWFSFNSGFDFLGKTRLYLNFYPILIIWVGYGLLFLQKIILNLKFKFLKEKIKHLFFLVIVCVFIIVLLTYLEKADTNFPTYILEARLPEEIEKEIPPTCVIILHEPIVLKASTNLNAVSLKIFLSNASNFKDEIFKNYNCVLFLEELFCFNFGEKKKSECESIKRQYSIVPEKIYVEQEVNYTLYFISNSKR